ncbi:vesicle-associated membrane protein 2-like [Stomoxys calcitrans]|uniref:vesicle-associated membrane protein 2-like n=1 Tax=Stomoxys calcitrans TaxID=35570 RepID=UPI0027E38DCE|nr:vesicle-associated membrane protein 2-like [Stomoxys calcitrans]
MSDDQLYEHVYYSKRTPTLDAYQTPKLLQQTQEQADEIVEIMCENINKVMARKIKLEDLNETAESVERLASNFQVGAVKVKRKKWWAQMRAKIALGVAVFIFILFVIDV